MHICNMLKGEKGTYLALILKNIEDYSNSSDA